MDDARHLVADDAPVGPGHGPQEAVAPPDVQVAAADVGPRDAHHDRARLRVGHRELGDLHGLAGSEEQGGAAHGAHRATASDMTGGDGGSSGSPTFGNTSVANSS